MTLREPLDFGVTGASKKVSRYLDAIELVGLALGPGHYIKLKLTIYPPSLPRESDDVRAPVPEWRTFLIVADDPPGERAVVVTKICRENPGELSPAQARPIRSAEFRFPLAATLGIGLAPGGTFLLTALDDPNGTLDASDVRFVAVYATTRWLDYLPGVFQQTERNTDFLTRYLGALFIDGERFETVLDSLGDYLVPSRLPSLSAARFLAGWFDIDIDAVVPKCEREERRLKSARVFLARVLPFALSSGTAAAVQTWIDAVAEARGMCEERRGRVMLVEGYKMRRLFTLPRVGSSDPEPSPLARHWGWLPASAPVAPDPLAGRAFLDDGRTLDHVTLGLPDERDDPVLLQRVLGSRVWLFIPAPENEEPASEEWQDLLHPVLPAHLKLEVVINDPAQFPLGYNAVLGVTAAFFSQETAVGPQGGLPS